MLTKIQKHFFQNKKVQLLKKGSGKVRIQDGLITFSLCSIFPSLQDDIMHELCHVLLAKKSELKTLNFGENETRDLEFRVISLQYRICELLNIPIDEFDKEGNVFSLDRTYKLGRKKTEELLSFWSKENSRLFPTLEDILNLWNKQLNLIN